MNERSVILNAIRNKENNTLDICPPEDAISKLVKNKRRRESFRNKPCSEWSNIDFLRYLDYILKDFGVVRQIGNIRYDSDQLNQIYDLMAKILQTKMRNIVLKDYIDWWCSIWASRLTERGVWLANLKQPHLIRRFLSRYECESEGSEESSIAMEDIYNLGGLSMLLMERGIVASYLWIKSNVANPIHDIQYELSRFSGKVLSKVMELTIRNAPYKCNPIDFISLSRLFLQKHGLSSFERLNYKEYFHTG